MKRPVRLALSALILLVSSVAVAAGTATPGGTERSELFEREIRPLFLSRCETCHGEAQARGGLRLTSRTRILQGGTRGPALVPGKPDESLLFRAVQQRGDLKMPPAGRLTEREIAMLRRWIAEGALWPDRRPVTRPSQSGELRVTTGQRRWWAFQPIRIPPLPSVPPAGHNSRAMLSPIDRFIRAGLARQGLSPAPPTDPRTLIRRATFDLTGLPPSPEEVETFVRECEEWERGSASQKAFGIGSRVLAANPPIPNTQYSIPRAQPAREHHSSPTGPSPYEKLIDRLLASPAYGVRQARHWLDVVRYADYHDGDPKARTASCEPLQAWRYRDWVVDAFNRDLPYDRFIVHQIAGDLLPGPEGQEFYADGLVATTFLTNGSWDRGDADKEKMVSDMVDDQIDTVGKAFLGLTLGCARCHDHKFDPFSTKDYYALAGIFYSTHILKDIGAKGGEYTLNRVPLATRAYVARRTEQLAQLESLNKELAELDKRNPKPPADDPARQALVARRDGLQRELLPEPPLAEAAQEGGTAGGLFPKIQDVPVHIRGSYTRLGEVVPRRMPSFFAGPSQPPIAGGSGRRELAAWITSRTNPLTARVIVNRVWQWHFGTGLIRTPNNFGMLSERPSHPELLDWLAAHFAGISGSRLQISGAVGSAADVTSEAWSLKSLHRMIMLSETYQQASRVPAERSARDPENRWLGRFPARRLEAEAIRDSMLAAAGRLDLTQGGPASADLNVPRRSLYVQTARWDRGSFAVLFDAANPDASEERRNVSTVAPQALFLLNHDFTLTQARHLAERLLRDVPHDEPSRIQRAYHLLFARPATPMEIRLHRDFLHRPGTGEAAARWQDFAHVLLCSNELVYLD